MDNTLIFINKKEFYKKMEKEGFIKKILDGYSYYSSLGYIN